MNANLQGQSEESDTLDKVISQLADGTVSRLKSKWQFNHSGRQALEMFADDLKEHGKAKIQSLIDAAVVEALNGASATPKDAKSPLESTSLPPATLMEKLAAIEHERWSDWQKWCHKILEENIKPANFALHVKPVLVRWEKQADTPYKDLSESEKQSDRDQVMRYWKLIDEYIAALSKRPLDGLEEPK